VTQQINLFNPIFRKQKKYFSSATMGQALLIITVACALLAGDAAVRARALSMQAAATDTLLSSRQQRLTIVKAEFAPRQKSSALAADIVATQEGLSMLQNAASEVKRGGFGDTMGFSPYFRAMARQRLEGLWLTELRMTSGGTAIGIEGNALQAPLVPQYMSRLASEPVMKGKAFATLSMTAVAPLPATKGDSAAQPLPVASPPSYLKFSLQSLSAGKPAAVVPK
jgi:hypothetical protein